MQFVEMTQQADGKSICLNPAFIVSFEDEPDGGTALRISGRQETLYVKEDIGDTFLKLNAAMQ